MLGQNLSLRLGAITAAVLLVAGCQGTPSAHQVAGTGAASVAAAPLLRQDAFDGVYEVAVTGDAGAVFVATTKFDPQSAGLIQRLDGRTLQTLQTIQVPRRSFALGLNRTTGTLYVGNTLDGSLTAVDASSGVVKGVIQLAQPVKNADGKESVAHTRKVIVDEKHNRVFVTSPGKPGLVWIVDGATNTLKHTITSPGLWTAGAAYDVQANRLYVSQGGVDEILAIDPDAGQIVGRISTGDSTENTAEGSKHFFINLALDAKGQRLFGIDSSTNQLYAFDIASRKVLTKVAVGVGALEVLFNPQRNEIVTTHRGVSRTETTGTGAVTVYDATTFSAKRVIDLPAHPNSLAVTPDGKTLYVTVKAPRGDKHPAARKDAKESVVRIDL